MTAGPSSREAAAVLGVPPDAPAEAVRAAFLRVLPADGFVPPEEQAAAVNALAETNLPLSRDAREEATGWSLADVEAFAAAYWSLPPADRRVRWVELSGRCRDELSAARLRHLEPGLDVPGTPHPDPGAEEIAALVRELFLLPPRARAVRRAEWLAGQAEQFPKWMAVAQVLLREPKPLAWLEPRLFDWFGMAVPPRRVTPTDDSLEKHYSPMSCPIFMSSSVTPTDESLEEHHVERRPVRLPDPDDDGEGCWAARDIRNAKWVMKVGIALLIAMVVLGWIATAIGR